MAGQLERPAGASGLRFWIGSMHTRGGGPMRRWIAIAALALAMTGAVPAWADDAEDCGDGLSQLLKTEPARAAAACRRLAEQGNAEAQSTLGGLYYSGQGLARDRAEALKWWYL